MQVYQQIARTFQALLNCEQNGNLEWIERHNQRLDDIVNDYLPSGSGIDTGCFINKDKTNGNRLVIDVAFHCMDPNGFYCGWRDYQIVVLPSLQFGFDLLVKGKDYNGIKSYLADLFQHSLTQEIP